MPFAHVGLPVGNHYTEVRDFYKAILAPLGYELMMEGEETTKQYCGFGTKDSGLDFWLLGDSNNVLNKYDGVLENRAAPVHVAFQGKSTEHIDGWYEAAIKAGAVDNGKPGPRPQYRKGYYGAFVLDPLGNNIEVVFVVED